MRLWPPRSRSNARPVNRPNAHQITAILPANALKTQPKTAFSAQSHLWPTIKTPENPEIAAKASLGPAKAVFRIWRAGTGPKTVNRPAEIAPVAAICRRRRPRRKTRNARKSHAQNAHFKRAYPKAQKLVIVPAKRPKEARAVMKHILMIGALVALAACDTQLVTSNRTGLTEITGAPPPGAESGACWGKTVSRATIETVTHKVLVQPAQISSDGRVQAPPVYRDETRQDVVVPRREQWFQRPCAADMTVEFVSSVQRALLARDYYSGPITGMMDARTRRAVRRYQVDQGLESEILSVAAARKLGLWTIDLEAPPPEADNAPVFGVKRL